MRAISLSLAATALAALASCSSSSGDLGEGSSGGQAGAGGAGGGRGGTANTAGQPGSGEGGKAQAGSRGGGAAGSSTDKGGSTSAGGNGGGGASAEAGSGVTAGTGATGDAGAGGEGGGEPCTSPGVTLEGRRLLVDCEPFHLRGVCWNPVRKGENHPAGLDFAGAVERDGALMQAIGINVVRTYEPLTDTAVLDALFDKGIRVLNGVYVYGGDATSVVTARVNAVKAHPAILGWVLGNEWNYNGLYVNLSHADALARLNEAATLILAADATRPIVTVYGEVPAAETVQAMPDIDLWGINAYRGLSFGDLFDVWASRSEKPMFLAEYGADAYDANDGEYDPASQAMAVGALTREIIDQGAAFSAQGVAAGGTLFEWNDEWWKDQSGALDAQDVGGIAPGGGPYPDSTFNEEWWGIVDIDRATRPAYDALGEAFAEVR